MHSTPKQDFFQQEEASPIVVDPRFKSHIRPLSSEERALLESSILADGCRDALVVWRGENILLDGHNRYAICTQHNLPFRIEYKDFAHHEDALDWLIDNQLSRRNLNPDEITYYIGSKYNRLKGAHGGDRKSSRQSGDLKTSEILADEHNVGSRTVERAGKFHDAVEKLADTLGDDVREIVLSGDIKASRQDIQDLAAVVEIKPEETRTIIETVKAGKAASVKDARSIHDMLKKAELRFVEFVLRMQFKESWRVNLMTRWYESNHSDHSKFAQVEFTGLLQIPDGKTYDVKTDELKALLEGEKEWAKVVRKLEMDAAQMDKRHAILNTPDEIYSVIYADPPWQYSNSGLNGSAEKHYPTMPTAKICSLLEESEIKVQENAVLFVWTTNSHIPDVLDVIKAWGFEYKANFVWVKDSPAYGKLAFYNRGQHELLFIATRGKFTPFHDLEELPVSIIQAPKGEHSAKPDCTRDLIESLYPEQRYLELFARQHPPRKNWTFWGNEESERVYA